MLEDFKEPKGNAVQSVYYQCYREKLYEIRFGLSLYEQSFHFDEYLVYEKISL